MTTRYGAGGGTRTHTESPPADFESATSTIPSHRHILSRNSQNSHRREQGENSLQKPYFIVTGKPWKIKVFIRFHTARLTGFWVVISILFSAASCTPPFPESVDITGFFDLFVFLLSKYGMSWCSLLTAQKSGLERTGRELRYNPFSREEWWT